MNKRKLGVSTGFILLITAMLVKTAHAELITTRVAGATRYDTCREVLNSGWTTSKNVIIASGENYPDALGAATLSHKYDAPILLVHGKSVQENPLLTSELNRLNTKNIILLGGIGVVPQAVEDGLKKGGYTSQRISGATRYETAVKIAEQLENVNEIMIANGDDFGGSLSAAPISGLNNTPILLVSNDTVPAAVTNYIKTHTIKTTYLLGDSKLISESVASKFPNVKRITGNTRYSLNQNIIRNFETPMAFNTVYTTSGEGFADALSGIGLAVKKGNPILFVNKNNNVDLKSLLTGKVIKNNVVLGGEGAVSTEVVNDLFTSFYDPSENKNGNTSSNALRTEFASIKDKRAYLLGEEEKSGDFAKINGKWQYTNESAKKQNIESITVKTWVYIDDTNRSKGKKTVSKTIDVNKKLSKVATQIFRDIYDLPQQFPIRDVGGFRPSDGFINHPAGSAIDINADSNYYVQFDKTRRIIQQVGTHYDPGNDPYSVTPEVIKVFESYGWEWGGKFPTSKDYMHFSYLGG